MLLKFKNKLETNEAQNRKKLKTASSHNSKFTGSYKKRSEYVHIILLSNVDSNDNNGRNLSLFRPRTKQQL